MSSNLSNAERGGEYGEGLDSQSRGRKIKEDLNVILVVSGLLSAVITSFMLYIQPRLEPDPIDEATALLRILVYNTNKTAFGGEVPQISRWNGPPKTLLASEYMLYVSLLASLGGGSVALVMRLIPEVEHSRPYFEKAIYIEIWVLTYAFSFCCLCILLQLPVVVNSSPS